MESLTRDRDRIDALLNRFEDLAIEITAWVCVTPYEPTMRFPKVSRARGER